MGTTNVHDGETAKNARCVIPIRGLTRAADAVRLEHRR